MDGRGILPGKYDPDLIPQSADDDDDTSYNRKTGLVIEDHKPMSEEEFRYVVKQAIEDSQTYIDSYLAPERERAVDYYLAKPFGNEEEGRSKVVLTEVRDTVLAMLPSLLRIFTSSDKVIEFIPQQPEDIESAEQATDLINYIFMQENAGFRVMHDAMKDALIEKTGVLTWHKVDEERVEYHSYSGISPDEFSFITNDPDVEVDEYTEVIDMETNDMQIELSIRRVVRTPKYVVECIPPEQFLIDNEATSLDTALYVGRRKLATVSELVSMGYDQEIIEENAGTGGFEMNGEALARNPADQSFFGITNATDETTDKVFYVESYVRVDKDGDGIAELHRVCSVGNGAYILYDEVVNDVPFALLEPDPTPHTIFGQSIADQTMDLQLTKSSIMRNTLDSLAQSIHPRTVVVEGQVNLDDVMNVETGAIIRARAPGMVAPLSEPFVGQQALGVMAYLDEIKTQRTGISRASQGLDADALQSTTSAAVQAQLSSSQERIEMIARLFADGFKRCFQGLLKLVVQHQDKAKIIRLRNKFIPIDPRGWNPEMDMIVNIALGRGSDEQKMMFLTQIISKQEQILQQFGPYNPLVDIEQYRNALAQVIQLSGFQDPDQFVKDVNREEVMRFMQSQLKEEKPDPATILAQVEAEKIKADIVINSSKQELERQKAASQADYDRDKLYVDAYLKAMEINSRYDAQVDVAAIKGEVETMREEVREMFARPVDEQTQQPVPEIPPEIAQQMMAEQAMAEQAMAEQEDIPQEIPEEMPEEIPEEIFEEIPDETPPQMDGQMPPEQPQ